MPRNELLIRLNKLEESLDRHLQESGEIRTDLSWIKKSLWTLVTAVITFNVGLAMYVFNHLKQ